MVSDMESSVPNFISFLALITGYLCGRIGSGDLVSY